MKVFRKFIIMIIGLVITLILGFITSGNPFSVVPYALGIIFSNI